MQGTHTPQTTFEKEHQPLTKNIIIDWLSSKLQVIDVEKFGSGLRRVALPFSTSTVKTRLNIIDVGQNGNLTYDNCIHSHRNQFQSALLAGSYTHSFYQKTAGEDFTEIGIFRDNTRPVISGKYNLEKVREVNFKQGSHFSWELHQITKWEPMTITLNFVRTSANNRYQMFVPNTFDVHDTEEFSTGKDPKFLARVVEVLRSGI